MGRKRATPETLERVGALHAAGLSYRAIAAKIGYSPAGVWHLLGKLGLQHQRLARVRPDQLRRAVEVYATGATLTATARAVGCSVYSVWTYLKSQGLLRQQEVDSEAIDRALAEGLTPFEVGRRLGVNLQVVLDHLRQESP